MSAPRSVAPPSIITPRRADATCDARDKAPQPTCRESKERLLGSHRRRLNVKARLAIPPRSAGNSRRPLPPGIDLIATREATPILYLLPVAQYSPDQPPLFPHAVGPPRRPKTVATA